SHRATISRVDPPDVIHRFSIRGNAAAVLQYGAFAGIIRRQSEIDISVEHLQESSQVSRSGVDIFDRVVDVPHAEFGRRRRHQLHQSARPDPRYGSMIESRLFAHHKIDQRRIKAVLAAAGSYQLVKPLMPRRVTQTRIRRRLLMLADRDIADHPFNIRAVNESLHLAQAVTDPIRILPNCGPDGVRVNLRPPFENDPRYFARYDFIAVRAPGRTAGKR